jgi:hypothetical protein
MKKMLLVLAFCLSGGVQIPVAWSLSIIPSSQAQFNVQKARLMARFSSVAYEDPPTDMQMTSQDGGGDIKRYDDEFGVSIARPVPSRRSGSIHSGSEKEGLWEMSHVDACSPRPLNLMISKCVSSSPIQDDLENATFQWVALASNKETGAQFDAWRITTNPNGAGGTNETILVIAFRGTRLDTFVDLFTDIQLGQKMVSCADFVCSLDEEVQDQPSAQIMVHSGFLQAYTSIRSTLLQLISSSSDIDRIWMTGHSLGGALATLAVIDVGSIMKQQSSIRATTLGGNDVTFSVSPVEISAYVFGTPRVGNTALARRLRLLEQSTNGAFVREYFRVNAAGDAIPYLPRGKNVNRLGIDYVHCETTVILPSVLNYIKNSQDVSMVQLEEDAVERINKYVFRSDIDNKSLAKDECHKRDDILNKIRIYQYSDLAPDPLTEIDPEYKGFFPTNPLTWMSKSFQKFVLSESIRSFRILRGGFNREHRLSNYEMILCATSQEDVLCAANQ